MEKRLIQRNYAFLVFLAILLSVIVVGAFGIVTLWQKTNRDVVTVMNLTTEAKANEMDLILLKIRDAVDTVGAYAGARVVSSTQQLDQDVISRSLDEELHELFQSTAENIEGAVSYYIRFSEPYDSLVEGFAFRKNVDAGLFSPLTGGASVWISESGEGENDWFELAKSTGSPVWVPIREASYMGGYIFSYAVPFYFNEKLVGVSCVDVDFEVLAQHVRDVSIYENGYAYLTNDQGRVYYHPKIGYGVLLTEDDDDVPEVDAALADTSTHGKLISYDYQGQKKKMTFKSLINDMRLVVTANEEDVERETYALIRNIVVSSVVIMVIIVLLALLMERRMMHPVLDNMDDLAHLDGLTGLQNKTSFLERQSVLNQRIQDGNASFGFAMFDVNNLKMINDRYGHKRGDMLLLSVVEMLRYAFPDQRCYRIGGDEFVVLIEGENCMEEADRCMELVDAWQKQRKAQMLDPWETPSVASAFAGYDPKVHNNAEDVLARADESMYHNKQQMKGQYGRRTVAHTS